MRNLLVLICLACFCKAEAQNPSALTMADSLYAVGNYGDAITKYLDISPKNEGIYLKIARAYQARGTFGDALKNYQKAAKGAKNTIALNEYGKLLITTSHYQEADSVFTILTNAYQQNPNFFYMRGRAKMKFWDTAKTYQTDTLNNVQQQAAAYVNDFEQAVSLDSTHQKALYETAKYYLQRKDYPLVERLCKKALHSYADNVEIISLLAQNYFSWGYVSDAIPLFEKLLKLGQNSQFIYEKLGASYYKKRQFKEAISAYLKALHFSQEDYHLHANLAKLYNLTEDFENAEKHGKLAIYFKDLSLDTDYYTLGNTYKMHKDWQKAMDNYNKALIENPDHKMAFYHKAVVADNYYDDKREVLKLYDSFITKYEKGAAQYDPILNLARERRKILNTEIFMAQGD